MSTKKNFPVRPEKLARLYQEMERLGVREEDLEETFTTSTGPGGQKANRSKTCVVLVHKPTGVKVRCEETRSQALNRFLARRMLLSKLSGQDEAEREKARRRKARRRRRSRKKYSPGPRPDEASSIPPTEPDRDW